MQMQDLIVWGVVGVVLFGSWIANALKKVNEQREMREIEQNIQQHTPGRKVQAGGRNEPLAPRSRAKSAEELAAERRRQLQELARRRGGGKKAPQKILTRTKPGDAPENLTMAQRIERAKAKAKYRERAAQLAQAKTDAQATPQAAQPRSDKPAPPPMRSPKPKSKPKPAVRQTVRDRVLESSLDHRPTVSRIAEEHSTKVETKSTAPAQPPVLQVPRDAYSQKAASSRVWGGMSLRRAFIYKELFDQPLALRKMDKSPGSNPY